MPKVYLSHFSAYELLRYARVKHAKIVRCKTCYSVYEMHDRKTLKQLHNKICVIAKFKNKLDVIINSNIEKPRFNFVNFHHVKTKLQANNFLMIKVDDDVLQEQVFDKICISSAELCYLQLSKYLKQQELILYTMELCGTYAIDRNSEIGFASNLVPITNITLLKSMLKKLKGRYIANSKNAIKTLNWLAEGSASPAETKLFLLLCGPRYLGFFQIKKFNLNMKVKLSKEAKSICGFDVIRPDMSLPEKKFALEYDSKRFHENVDQNQNDKIRALSLKHDG